MKPKRILILTNAFPFYPGEQFLETEIMYWDKVAQTNDIYIHSASTMGKPRELPSKIHSVGYRIKRSSFNFLSLTFCKLYISELKYLRNRSILTFQTAKAALRSVIDTLQNASRIRATLQSIGGVDLAYSYWNNELCYAACILKDEGLIGRVISRAHRYDLYEHSRKTKHISLKRQFTSKIDRIYTLTETARQYYIDTFQTTENKVKSIPLGVRIPPAISKRSDDKSYNIVSLSYAVAVKRIDKIIDAISIASLKKDDYKVNWVHIGDGPMLEELKAYAREKFSNLHNIDWSFVGGLTNEEVRIYFAKNTVDCLVNSSESEGLPVSIMEAMSFGVPTIAPDVGGISDLVNPHTGILLGNNPSPVEIAEALIALIQNESREKLSLFSKSLIQKKYNAEVNYNRFINDALTDD